MDEDRVMVWGACDSGQLGSRVGDEELITEPRYVEGFGSAVDKVRCGAWRTATVCSSPNEVLVSKDGNGAVAAIGGEESARRIVDIACGEDFNVVLTEDSKLLSGGGAAYGQLGRGANAEQSTCLRVVKGIVNRRGVTGISAGAFHWLALTRTGEVFGCGFNNRGQLGIPGKKCVDEPERIYNLWGQAAVAVAAGESHSAVLTAHGDIFTFGSNRYGQLGVELTADSRLNADKHPSSPGRRAGKRQTDSTEVPQRVSVPDGLHYVAVACGARHTLALRSDGKIVAFGAGSNGQLGYGSTGNSSVPVIVKCPSEEAFVAVSAGGRHSAAIGESGELYTWGAGESGQLGNGDISDKLYPVRVSRPRRYRKRMRDGGSGNGEPKTSDEERGEGAEGEEQERVWVQVDCGTSHSAGVLSSPDRKLGRVELEKWLRVQPDSPTNGGILFGNPAYLVSRFLSKEAGGAAGIDVERAERVYTHFLEEFGDEAYEALSQASLHIGIDGERALERTIDSEGVAFRSSVSTYPEFALVLLLAMMNPVLQTEKGLTSLARFTSMAKSLRIGGKRAFINAVSNYFPSHILVTRLVWPLQTLIDHELRGEERMITETVINTVKTLYLIYCASEAKGARHRLVPLKEFYNATITQEVDLSVDYDRCFLGGDKSFSFCSYPFILDQEGKSILLRKELIHVQHNYAMQSLQTPNCEIRVRRDNIIQDALSELLKRGAFELRKPLKVTFDGEEGEDAGGLRKEFFQIAIEKLFSLDFGMFTYDEATRYHWLRSDSLEESNAFKLVGTLIGLAIYNDTILDLHFPPVLYKKLQGLDTDFDDLLQFAPEVARSLQAILDYEGDDLEEVFSVTFTVSYKSIFGEAKEHELVPGGSNKPVTQGNKREFVQLYQKWLLEDSIAPMFNEFRKGFRNMIPGRMLGRFKPEELEVLICGEKFDDVDRLEKCVAFDGGYHASTPVVTWFWKALKSLSIEQKRTFLAFVTGTDRVPAGGVEKLNFLVQRSGPDSDRLPTSHTCFNVLLLPQYSSYEKTRAKLLLAIENAQGFGLR